MTPERSSAEQFQERILRFMRMGTLVGVNNYVLEGPIDVPTVFENFVGIFPHSDPNAEDALVVVGGGVANTLDFYSRIAKIELPERVIDNTKHFAEVITDELRGSIEGLENFFIMLGLPTKVLAFGRARDTGEEVVFLCSTMGIRPQQALDDIKDRIKTRLAKLN